jgi:hypothetical protein
MAPSAAGHRTRRVLLAVELPLAIAIALTNPVWPAIAFAAGWTNWWMRLGPAREIPDFSWARALQWALVTAGTQLAGLALVGDITWLQAASEIGLTLVAVVVIADTYGALLPVYVGVGARVLLTGARHQRRADGDARRIIADVADAMAHTASQIAELPDRTPADDEARAILQDAVADMRAVAGSSRQRRPLDLDDVVTAALDEGGHGLWSDDARAIAVREHASREGRVLPVAVARPQFVNAGIASVVLDERVAADLHRLLVACIVEARVHGTRRVQTIVRRIDDSIEIRVANQPDPSGSASGGGHGGQEIRRLAGRLPGAGDVFRGSTDRSFIGARGDGELYGVRFTFSVGDTGPRGSRYARPGLRR